LANRFDVLNTEMLNTQRAESSERTGWLFGANLAPSGAN